jgi:hypothetical protein
MAARAGMRVRAYSGWMVDRPAGGYSFLPGLVFASQAVVASPGMAITRASFTESLPLTAGFDAVHAEMERLGRPLSALCGFDLRLPAARRLEDFLAFNTTYLQRLGAWGLLDGDSSPLARTNVAPIEGGVAEPGVLGFSYTVEQDTRAKTFVVSGVPEVPDNAQGPDDVVRLGESTPDALAEKLEFVVELIHGRLASLQLGWANDPSVHLYSAHDATMTLSAILARQGIHPTFGVTWHKAAPPVDLLELEVDVRRYTQETIIEP